MIFYSVYWLCVVGGVTITLIPQWRILPHYPTLQRPQPCSQPPHTAQHAPHTLATTCTHWPTRTAHHTTQPLWSWFVVTLFFVTLRYVTIVTLLRCSHTFGVIVVYVDCRYGVTLRSAVVVVVTLIHVVCVVRCWFTVVTLILRSYSPNCYTSVGDCWWWLSHYVVDLIDCYCCLLLFHYCCCWYCYFKLPIYTVTLLRCWLVAWWFWLLLMTDCCALRLMITVLLLLLIRYLIVVVVILQLCYVLIYCWCWWFYTFIVLHYRADHLFTPHITFDYTILADLHLMTTVTLLLIHGGGVYHTIVVDCDLYGDGKRYRDCRDIAICCCWWKALWYSHLLLTFVVRWCYVVVRLFPVATLLLLIVVVVTFRCRLLRCWLRLYGDYIVGGVVVVPICCYTFPGCYSVCWLFALLLVVLFPFYDCYRAPVFGGYCWRCYVTLILAALMHCWYITLRLPLFGDCWYWYLLLLVDCCYSRYVLRFCCRYSYGRALFGGGSDFVVVQWRVDCAVCCYHCCIVIVVTVIFCWYWWWLIQWYLIVVDCDYIVVVVVILLLLPLFDPCWYSVYFGDVIDCCCWLHCCCWLMMMLLTGDLIACWRCSIPFDWLFCCLHCYDDAYRWCIATLITLPTVVRCGGVVVYAIYSNARLLRFGCRCCCCYDALYVVTLRLRSDFVCSSCCSTVTLCRYTYIPRVTVRSVDSLYSSPPVVTLFVLRVGVRLRFYVDRLYTTLLPFRLRCYSLHSAGYGAPLRWRVVLIYLRSFRLGDFIPRLLLRFTDSCTPRFVILAIHWRRALCPVTMPLPGPVLLMHSLPSAICSPLFVVVRYYRCWQHCWLRFPYVVVVDDRCPDAVVVDYIPVSAVIVVVVVVVVGKLFVIDYVVVLTLLLVIWLFCCWFTLYDCYLLRFVVKLVDDTFWSVIWLHYDCWPYGVTSGIVIVGDLLLQLLPCCYCYSMLLLRYIQFTFPYIRLTFIAVFDLTVTVLLIVDVDCWRVVESHCWCDRYLLLVKSIYCSTLRCHCYGVVVIRWWPGIHLIRWFIGAWQHLVPHTDLVLLFDYWWRYVNCCSRLFVTVVCCYYIQHYPLLLFAVGDPLTIGVFIDVAGTLLLMHFIVIDSRLFDDC